MFHCRFLGDSFCSIIPPSPQLISYIQGLSERLHRPAIKQEHVQEQPSSTAQDAVSSSSEKEESSEEESSVEESSTGDSLEMTLSTKKRKRAGSEQESGDEMIENSNRYASSSSPDGRNAEKLLCMCNLYHETQTELAVVKNLVKNIMTERENEKKDGEKKKLKLKKLQWKL